MGLGMFEEHNPLPTEIRPQVSALLQTPFFHLKQISPLCGFVPCGLGIEDSHLP